jgi:Ca2+-dependent lipid-binding protein
LFKSSEGLEGNLKALAYEPCVNFITSDHKPIRGAFSIIPNEIMDIRSVMHYRNIRLDFQKMECSGLPAADMDGLSDPYLMILWDSVDLAAEETSFIDKLRALVHGNSWPRTKYQKKTLNPKWKGEKITLTSKYVTIGSDATLFVVVVDYDAFSKDDLLCVLPLNVKDLLMSMGNENQLTIDRPLQRNGRHFGRIKFELDVELTNRKKRGSFFSQHFRV